MYKIDFYFLPPASIINDTNSSFWLNISHFFKAFVQNSQFFSIIDIECKLIP
ncbi:hypothetical protein SAMN05421877_108197 [Sphingobacterium lactis]|uniref:Uncharacterized protein n=1 Tax=Sphingobacterium lactis TaxID=797291 RepID=A0A1H6AK83_9SPHI|nr:hypothetical protein SAMN05421877_108197 [Sphingobacterium lactis]